jgi:predicted transcriptional regulator
MKLSDYISENKLTQAAFGKLIGVSQAAIDRYLRGERNPHKKYMKRIIKVTGGQVKPNDFYLNGE